MPVEKLELEIACQAFFLEIWRIRGAGQAAKKPANRRVGVAECMAELRAAGKRSPK